MPDYKDFDVVLDLLTQDQNADQGRREHAREAHRFLKDRNGQWEQSWWDKQRNAPRYSFDMTTPIVDRVSGAMDKMDFGINVTPNGGQASVDVAKTYQGLIRNIQNISNAQHVFNQSARGMVICGMDGWRVVQKFVDDNSFEQDLVIENISNYLDRVWFDYGSEMQDKSDATRAYVLTAIPKDEYDEKWPDGTGKSVNDGRESVDNENPADFVVVGEVYYIETEDRELVLYSNGATYEEGPELDKVKDELAKLGIVEQKRRTRPRNKVFVRKFDGDGWLEPATETVFNIIPIVTTLANFEIFNNEAVYFGVVEKLLDSQRVLNYSASREVAEGALAPRAKYWLTKKQTAGHEATLATLNTNQDSYQHFNADKGNPGQPIQQGGAQINPGLRSTTDFAMNAIGQVSSMFAANMGENPGLQSGIAIKEQKASGDIGNVKFITSQEVAICYTWRILKDAIPKVYEAGRQVKILGQDGQSEMVTLGEQIPDEETGELITLNDLSQGTYDVVCIAGPSFKSQQSETVAAITEIGLILPDALQASSDILLANIPIPGFDDIAERQRAQLLKAGIIPVKQMTEDEKAQAKAAAQQQSQQPDALMVAAQAQMQLAQNEGAKVQVDSDKLQLERAKAQFQAQKEAQELEFKGQKQQLDFAKAQSDQGTQEIKNILAMMEQQRKDQETLANVVNTQANTIKQLREGFGLESFVGPGTATTIIKQADIVEQAQDKVTT